MKQKPRILIFAVLIIAALSLAACDATGAVSIEDLTGGTTSSTTLEDNSSSPRGDSATVKNTSMDDSSSPDTIKLKGVVEDVTANSITINGVTFTVDTTEDLTTYFEAGMVYKLEYTLNADSSISLVSFSLESMDDSGYSSEDEYEFTGMIEDVTANTLTFNGETFTVDTTEDLTTLFTAGEYYEIEYYMNADGTITLKSYSLEDSSMGGSSDDMYSSSDDSYNNDDNGYNNDDSYNDNSSDDSYDDNSNSSNNNSYNNENEHEDSNENND